MDDATALKKAVQSLLPQQPAFTALGEVPARGARAGAISTGRPSSTGAGTSGAFVETDASQRQYWSARTLTSSDGLFTIEVQPIRSILLNTGERAQFADPPSS